MIPQIREVYSFRMTHFINSILIILNSIKSQKAKEQTKYGILHIMGYIFMTKFVSSMQYICLGNAIWTVIMFEISISDYIFFLITKSIILFSRFSKLFLKKVIKTKKLCKIAKQNTFTNKIKIFSIIIGLRYFINVVYFENQYEVKQHLSVEAQFWLYDYEIIYHVGLGCERESIGQGRSYVDKNINVSLCFFSRTLLFSGNGGVICVTASSFSMNINYSMFYKCTCSNHGGAIYFNSSISCLRMICSNRCSASLYHFSYLYAFQVNQVEYLSASNCSHTTSGSYPIYLHSGNQRVDNTNSSMNKAYRGSSICIESPSSSASSYCTCSNNMVTDGVCIFFSSTSGIISMSYANIIHNNSPSRMGVVNVEGIGSKKMLYCIFKNNQNFLFNVMGGSLEVSHSFIDHSASFSRSTTVSTSNNNSFTNRITYQLQFFNSLHCSTDSPERTPDQSPTPKITPEESPMNTPEESLMNTPEETPTNTLENTPMNTPEDTPLNTLEKTPMNTVEKTPLNTPEETPMNTVEETPLNSPEETPMNTLEETPMNTLENSPMNTVEVTPMNTLEKTPLYTPEVTPMNTLEKTPLYTPEDTIMNTAEDTPMNTPEDTIMNTAEDTIMNTAEDTIMNTAEDTPMNTPEETPINTPEETPMNTLEETPLYTPEVTPINTLEKTPLYTPEVTPINTLEKTPLYTPEVTPINTLENTPLNTPEESLMKTLNEAPISNSNAISLRLVLVSISVIFILISIIYVFGLIFNSNQESSNMSCSKSDGNILETV